MDSVSGVFVPIDVFATDQGMTEDEALARIRGGQLTGRMQPDGWHVLVRMPSEDVPAAPVAPAGGRVVATLSGPVSLEGEPAVVVRDVNVPLSTMVGLILKLVVALVISGVILGGLGLGVMMLVQTFGQDLLDSLIDMVRPYLPTA